MTPHLVTYEKFAPNGYSCGGLGYGYVNVDDNGNIIVDADGNTEFTNIKGGKTIRPAKIFSLTAESLIRPVVGS